MVLKKKFDFICNEIDKLMLELNVPGVAIGIYINHEIYLSGFGVTSLENPLAITPKTLFQIGSVSKTITATVAMRLVDTGKLDLDVPIKNYLKDFKMHDDEVTNKLTLRHLLIHTGGWVGDYFPDYGDGDDALTRTVADLKTQPQQFRLGAMWSYNNSGFYLIGSIIEKICKKTFEEAVYEWVFKPLGMENSYYLLKEFYTKRFAIGHNNFSNGPPVIAHQFGCGRMGNAAGGIVSNVQDLLCFSQFSLNRGKNSQGEQLLSPILLDTMQQNNMHIYNGYESYNMGLSWFIHEINGVKFFEHSGGVSGQCAFLAFSPENNFAFTLLTNSSSGSALISQISSKILFEYFELDTEPKINKQDNTSKQHYIGTYIGGFNEKIVVKEVENKLIMKVIFPQEYINKFKIPFEHQEPSEIRIGIADNDRWVAIDKKFDGMRGEFIGDKNGIISWIRVGGRLSKKITN